MHVFVCISTFIMDCRVEHDWVSFSYFDVNFCQEKITKCINEASSTTGCKIFDNRGSDEFNLQCAIRTFLLARN